MKELLYLREQYGEVFATVMPDGLIVPWKPLSMGEFLHYDSLRRTGKLPPGYLEDEIFKKCVADKSLVLDSKMMKAGIVTTVVAAILAVSGPSSMSELSLMLDANRQIVHTVVLYDIINLIIQAYPAYTVEDILEWDYETVTLRFAQAEKKLLNTGMIAEPISFTPLGQQQEAPKPRPKIDSAELFNLYKEQKGEAPGPTPSAPIQPLSTTKQTVITKADIIESEAILVGHEKEMVEINKKVENTASIYKDYLTRKPGEKLKIKTTEERKAEAETRMEENRLKNLQNAKLRQRLDAIEMKKLLEVRERERVRKTKKKRRR